MTISSANEVIKRIKVARVSSPLAVFTTNGQDRFNAFPARTVKAEKAIVNCADRLVGVFDKTMDTNKIYEILQGKISKKNKCK